MIVCFYVWFCVIPVLDSPLVLMIGREKETELAEEKNSSKYNLLSNPGY